MKPFLRSALGLCVVFGLALAVWPFAQSAYARWNQARLQTAWQQAAPSRKQQTSQNANPAIPAQSKIQKPKPKIAWPDTRLVIPEIGLDAVVVQGADPASLRRGPGHYAFSVLPGQVGNCVIAGHRNVYGSYFLKLDALAPGSPIILRTRDATFNYHVVGPVIVQDNDTSVFTPMTPGKAQLTLITCTLPLSSERLVIFAQLD